MTGIDFLPAEFVQRRNQRRHRDYDRALVVAFTLLAAGIIAEPLIRQAAWTDHVARLRAELAHREAHLEPADRLHAQLRQITDEQRLWKLLHWQHSPTETLGDFSRSLPEEVHLTNVQWTHQAATPTVSPAAAASQPDLERLWQRRQGEQVIVLVQGIASEDRALTRWLTALHDDGEFARIEVLSLDRQPTGDMPRRTFSLRLELVNPLTTIPEAAPPPDVEDPGPQA